jgi:hypothetical protein
MDCLLLEFWSLFAWQNQSFSISEAVIPLRPSATFLLNAALFVSNAIAVLAPANASPGTVSLAQSPALACLTVTEGTPATPDYPAAYLQNKKGGKVEVQLEFTAPGEAPKVTLLTSTPYQELNTIIEQHVRRFRVPCMVPAHGTVTLLQNFVFDPDGSARAQAYAARDQRDAEREQILSCRVHVYPTKKLEYPPSALRKEIEGNVIVKMRFTAKDQPPIIEVLSSPNSVNLRAVVEKHAVGWRLPCMTDQPIETLLVHMFTLDREWKTRLADTELAKLLKSSKNVQRPVYFDFDKMACPFDVRTSYHRPFDDNTVEQVGAEVASRRPFLEWLAKLTLNLDTNTSGFVFASTMKVSIPCGQLDL